MKPDTAVALILATYTLTAVALAATIIRKATR